MKVINGKLFEYDTQCGTHSCIEKAKKRLKDEGFLYVRAIKKSDEYGSYWEIWKSKDVPRSKKVK